MSNEDRTVSQQHDSNCEIRKLNMLFEGRPSDSEGRNGVKTVQKNLENLISMSTGPESNVFKIVVSKLEIHARSMLKTYSPHFSASF